LRARRVHTRGDEHRRALYTGHRWRVEGVHGEAKTQHGLRRAARRGLWNVAIQAYLTAVVMNLKRLAAVLLHFFRFAAGYLRCDGFWLTAATPHKKKTKEQEKIYGIRQHEK
jgi:hypothetical protein